MPSTIDDLIAAIVKYAKAPPTAHNEAALQRNITLLRGRLPGAEDVPDDDPVIIVPPTAPAATADEIWEKFLDAEDAALEAAGKPHGRDGAERGGMSRGEHIALVEGLGIPNALAILAASGYSFGPEPGEGATA